MTLSLFSEQSNTDEWSDFKENSEKSKNIENPETFNCSGITLLKAEKKLLNGSMNNRGCSNLILTRRSRV